MIVGDSSLLWSDWMLAGGYVVAIGLWWWLQPLALHYLLRLAAEERRNDNNGFVVGPVAYVGVAMMCSGWLGIQLHSSLHGRSIKPMMFILLWYAPAMQLLRYFHLVSVGPAVFRRTFGLTDWKRIQLFMLCAPTVVFENGNDSDSNSNSDYTNQNRIKDDDTVTRSQQQPDLMSVVRQDFVLALTDIVVTVALCAGSLFLQLHIILPMWAQTLTRVYIMGYSTAIFKLVLECPSAYYAIKCYPDTVARILPIYRRPQLTRSPRDLWHRWSVAGGYHLRKAYYQPALSWLLRRTNDSTSRTSTSTSTVLARSSSSVWQRLVAAAVPFLINCILHVTWWSWVIKGESDHIYWSLLFVYPLVSFALQDGLEYVLPPTWHRVSNLALLWMGFIWIGEPMALAHGLNTKLVDVCRANLLLPPLPS